MSETTLKCCWLNPENEESGCGNPATHEVWDREDDGSPKYEGDTLCCAEHLAWAMPPARRDDGLASNGVVVYTLPAPGRRS